VSAKLRLHRAPAGLLLAAIAATAVAPTPVNAGIRRKHRCEGALLSRDQAPDQRSGRLPAPTVPSFSGMSATDATAMAALVRSLGKVGKDEFDISFDVRRRIAALYPEISVRKSWDMTDAVMDWFKQNEPDTIPARSRASGDSGSGSGYGKSYSSGYGGGGYSSYATELAQLKEKLKAGDREATHIRDQVITEQVKAEARRRRSVTLLLGNESTPVTPEIEQRVTAFVQPYVDAGYAIIYDADSSLAPVIRRAAGAHPSLLGITQSPAVATAADAKVVAIENPYLRMKALGAGERVIMSEDSVNGLGLQIDDDVHRVFPLRQGWTNGYEAWIHQNSRRSLGVRSPLRSPEVATAPSVHERATAAPAFAWDPDLVEISGYTAKSILEKAANLTQGEHAMAGPAGAVIFGSGQAAPDYIDLVYSSARFLAQQGVPVVTGGAGGLMEVANAGAYDAGGESVGIPLGSGFRLSTEAKDADHAHTRTISAAGYEARIPLLLHRRPIILIAPGGNGTMQEIATAFVELARSPGQPRELVFMSSAYYGPFVEWLRAQPFPADFLASIHVIDRAEELGPIIQKVLAHPGIQETGFRGAPPKAPRNDHTQFEPPAQPAGGERGGGKPAYKDDEYFDWGY
jgi:uncharacterized protein (TIGR00725 family)